MSENVESTTVNESVEVPTDAQPDATGETSVAADVDEKTLADLKAGKIIPLHRFEEINQKMKKYEAELQKISSQNQKSVEPAKKVEAPKAEYKPSEAELHGITTDDVAKEIYGYSFDELDTTEKLLVTREYKDRVAESEAVMDVIRGEIETAISDNEFSELKPSFNEVLAHMSESGIHDPKRAIRDMYFDKIVEARAKSEVEKALKRKNSAAKARVETGGSVPAGTPLSTKEKAFQILRQKQAAGAAH